MAATAMMSMDAAEASLDDSHACPICRDVFTDAFSTLCGHTFCFACITQHLEHIRTCPCCAQPLSADALFPNLALDKLLRGLSRSGHLRGSPGPGSPRECGVGGNAIRGRAGELAEALTELPLEQLTPLLRVISDKHKHLVMNDRQVSMNVLRDFLSLSWRRKSAAVDALEREIECIDGDLEWVERQVAELGGSAALDAFAAEAAAANPAGGARGAQGGVASTSGASAARNNSAASLVCEMLSAWGIDRADAPPKQTGRRASVDAAAARYAAAKNSGFYGTTSTAAGASAGAAPGSSAPPVASPSVATLADAPRSGGGSKRSSMDMMRGAPPSKRTDSLERLGSGSSAASDSPGASGSGSGSGSGRAPRTDPAAAKASFAALALSEQKRRRVFEHFGDLQRLYSSIRIEGGGERDGGGGRMRARARTGTAAARDLEKFSRTLDGATKHDRLRVVGQLRHADPMSAGPSGAIVSSIEFDVDGAFFATAGVSKRIQFFDFRGACGTGSGPELGRGGSEPAQSISTRSKLSCLSYNKHVRNHIASSDYEGVVTVWDVETRQSVAEFEEHDKRAWTVDYCRTDPRLLASGSDDGRVKIWSTAHEGSVLELDVRANVCCAQYGPNSAHQLAVGCADHRVHLFDLRNPSEAVAVLSGHRKAVSYVRFLPTGDELASASTDSTICVWDVRGSVIDAARKAATPSRPKVLEGHVNEKNFVGLSVAGDLIACGSETNEVFVYHKSFNRPLVKYNFDEPVVETYPGVDLDGGAGTVGGSDGSSAATAATAAAAAGGGRATSGAAGTAGAGGGGGPPMAQQFVSAVCWRGEQPVLLAANSHGIIKVLQLVEG